MKIFQSCVLVCAVAGGLNVPALATTQPFQVANVEGWGVQTQNPERDQLFKLALAAYRQGKFEEALANCAKISKLNPTDYRPYALTGYIYSAQRKYRSASEAYAAALSLQPQLKELYLAKANVDRMRNAHKEALAAAQKATEVDPSYAEAFAMIGDLLKFNKERRPEAVAALRTAIKLEPKLPEPYDDLGGLLAYAKDEKGAEEVFRQGMAADPAHMGGRFALGRLMVKQGRLAEARQLWDGRTSDEDRSYPQFIELLKRAENLKRATDALAQQPHDPDALVDMGMAVMDGESWVVDGRQARALLYFKEALKLKPTFARAQYGVVKAYIQGVDFGKDESKTVVAELIKLRQLDPKLAEELEEYRKTYQGGIIGTPVKDQ